METDLLGGKYGVLGINDIADWLGHSPKVMLSHYKRVSEEKFRQVSQYKPRQYRSCNTQGHFDSPKSPESCVNPEMTRENTNSGLAVYLTVQNPKQGGISGNHMESGQVPMLAHVLENKVHEGSNQQEVVQSVNCLDCDNGEATVQLANIALLLRRLAPPKITQKFHYPQNA